MLKVVHVAAGPADALHSGTFPDFLSQYLSKVKKKYIHKHWQLTTRRGMQAGSELEQYGNTGCGVFKRGVQN